MRRYLSVLGFIGISQLAGIIGSIFTINSIESWYMTLNKPPLTPPNWLFGPVWLTLYTIMGIAAYLVWKKKDEDKRADFGVKLFFSHLLLNAIWSILFFGLRLAAVALVDIVVVWVMIVWMIKVFWPIDRRASYLLIPYLTWVTLATYLNWGVWRLN